jgi:MFS family permease
VSTSVSPAQLRRWRRAVFTIFLLSGLSIATWASRVPAIKVALGIDNLQVGTLLLIGGVASMIGLSLSSLTLARFGARRGMFAAMIVFAVGLVVIGVGADVAASTGVVALGLVLWGFGNGSVDVMMNVEGAVIESHGQVTILPLFHAFFSFGTVIGAGLGVVLIALGADVLTHLGIVAVAVVAAAVISTANVPARREAGDAEADAAPRSRRARFAVAFSAWREPRTYALGVVMLGMSFAEGGANDWLALGVVEGHGAPQGLGALALAVFSISMTAVRVFGGPLVDRFGRVPVLRVLSATAAGGLLLFILAPSLPWVFAGAALWGIGTSLGFPLGMSAAADDPERAAARVSAASTIGYIAFLAGPPVLGLISEQIGLLSTLYILVALVAASGLASSAAKPLPGAAVGGGRPRREDEE